MSTTVSSRHRIRIACALLLTTLLLWAVDASLADAAASRPAVDVPRATPAISAAFTTTNQTPLPHTVGVDLGQTITATFDATIEPSSVTSRTFVVRSNLRGLFTEAATVSGATIAFDPVRDFFAGEQVEVVATSGISSTGGGPLAASQWSFTAGRVDARCVGGFTPIDYGLIHAAHTSVAWGDYDNDGDLDILLTGDNAGNRWSKIYRNDIVRFSTGDERVFTDSGATDDALIQVNGSSVDWGDYDNDGDLDILIAGYDGSVSLSHIYRNEIGSDGQRIFVESGATDDALIGVSGKSSAAWGDYDNDGDLDILLAGFDPASGPTTRLYRNEDCAPIIDGNGDGIPDSQQVNVETITSGTGNYVTLAAPQGVTLQNAQKVQPPVAPPQNVQLPQGVIGFDATGISPGGSFSMTLTIQTGLTATSYWKYGKTPANQTDHWYEFLYDGTTGAVINGRTIILYFVDGQRGDSDLQANGVVKDPGAPGGSAIDEFLWLPAVARQ